MTTKQQAPSPNKNSQLQYTQSQAKRTLTRCWQPSATWNTSTSSSLMAKYLMGKKPWIVLSLMCTAGTGGALWMSKTNRSGHDLSSKVGERSRVVRRRSNASWSKTTALTCKSQARTSCLSDRSVRSELSRRCWIHSSFLLLTMARTYLVS